MSVRFVDQQIEVKRPGWIVGIDIEVGHPVVSEHCFVDEELAAALAAVLSQDPVRRVAPDA